eukprot:gene1302-2516_t
MFKVTTVFSTLFLILLPSSRALVNEARTSAITHFDQDLINPDQSKLHEVVFVVKQRNLKLLEAILFNISDPNSSQYGQHFSREEVANLTSSPDSVRIIQEFLIDAGVTSINHTHHGEFITVKASIATLEQILSTKFHHFTHSVDHEHRITRARSYTLPHPIQEHVSYIMNVIDFHYHSSNKSPTTITRRSLQSNSDDGKITPSKLISFYNIFTTTASNKATQSVYSAIGQYFSSTDILQFQTMFKLPNDAVDFDVNGRNNPSMCAANAEECKELNLDCMYILAIAQNAPTTVIYDSNSDGMTSWITATAGASSPPLVHTISYGIPESSLDSDYMDVFNTQAMKLGAMGVTIVVACGDDGAPGFRARNDASQCSYDPMFPASSPYVVSVGATMGVESGTTEVACEANLGGHITTGGGFSTLAAAPSFQSNAVDGYFASKGSAAAGGYNRAGRGFPDISLAGKNYAVVIGGTEYLVSGSSAAAPVFAGMVSLLNTARLNSGKPSIGWMTPALYSFNGAFANDITSGNNKCTEKTCCSQGFDAAVGWDPVTGFGSVDFQKLYNLLQ